MATVKVSGAKQNVSISRPGRFDLVVSGDGNTVWIPSGNAIRTLSVSCVHHGITLATGASVESIRLSGVGTTVHLPKNVHPAVSGSGVGNRILNNAEAEVPL